MSDLISRQAAIDACLELLEARRKWDTAEGRAEMRGIDAVVCAIHDLPSAQPECLEDYCPMVFIPKPCEDAISRSEAVRVASGYCHPANVAKELAKLPSVTPDRNKGKWIEPGYDSIFTYVESYAKCDQCGKVVNYGREMNFCPNCGADMRGKQDDKCRQV